MSCSVELGVPLELQQGSGLLSSCEGKLGVLLKLWWETKGSSSVATGDSELLLSFCSRNSVFLLRYSAGLEPWQGTQDSSHVWVVLRVLLDLGWGLLLNCIGVTHL